MQTKQKPNKGKQTTASVPVSKTATDTTDNTLAANAPRVLGGFTKSSTPAPAKVVEMKPAVKSAELGIVDSLVGIIRLQADAIWFHGKVKNLTEIPGMRLVDTVIGEMVVELEKIEKTFRAKLPAGAADPRVTKAEALRAEWTEKSKS